MTKNTCPCCLNVARLNTVFMLGAGSPAVCSDCAEDVIMHYDAEYDSEPNVARTLREREEALIVEIYSMREAGHDAADAVAELATLQGDS